jgi:hypothetical protein
MTIAERRRIHDPKAASLATQSASTMMTAAAVSEPDPFDEFVAHFLRCLEEGTCPSCERDVEFEQRGVNVFGSCGHRLYIGVALPVRRRRRPGNGSTRGVDLSVANRFAQRQIASGEVGMPKS